MRVTHRHAGVRQAAEPRYPVPTGGTTALAGLGCLQVTERVGEWMVEGRPHLRSLVNPGSGRKRARECQVKVAGHRAGTRARRRGFGEYLKQGAGERSVSGPPQREPQDPGQRERPVEGADTGDTEDAREIRIRVAGDAA